MKTSVIEIHDMLSVLSVDGVERRIGEVPGVESVTVNYAAGSATVRYDETRLELADIKSGVRQIGNEADAAPAAASAGKGHGGHAASGGLPATPAPAVPKSSPDSTSTVGGASSGGAQEGKAAPSAPPKPSPAAPASAAAPATPKSTPGAAPAGDEQKSKAPAQS